MMRRISVFLLITFLPFQAISLQAEVTPQKKALILGIDGMDPKLLQKYIDEGKMPHFKQLIDGGGDFKKLITSYPPQSPVAWSNFAIGGNPGRHGIFDFIHRYPSTLIPYLSITETKAPEKMLNIFGWQIPLSAGSVNNLRRGTPYWAHLCNKNIATTICQIPANYPPKCPCQSDKFHALSGMGTPDLLGTQGTFSFYSSEKLELKKVIGGGRFYQVDVNDGKVESKIYGPPHPYKDPKAYKNKKDEMALTAPFTIWIDEENGMAKLNINHQDVVLKKGEFSEFVQIKFEVIPFFQSITAITRFYLKDVKPFKLYVSPIDIDPSNPAVPISEPPSFAQELFKNVGYFYTQNMPPDTKALEHKVLSDAEFLKQITIVFKEEEKRLDYELSQFKEGLLFHYFSVLDQLCHTFWRFIDPEHPLYTVEGNQQFGKAIENFYIEFDRILGKVQASLDKDTLLIIMSDHGFTSFRRGVNLNPILLNKGYISLIDPTKPQEGEFFAGVDWNKTKAYNLGINALYINLQGREPHGTVSAAEYDALTDEIKKTLLDYVDAKTGLHPIKDVSKRAEIYSGPYLDQAPDLIVGYDHGYRGSWDTILGEMPKEEVVDNKSTWSGDHTIYFNLVPGVVLSNRKIAKAEPSLIDIAPAILEYFGIQEHPEMEGKSIFAEASA